jgi:hypothetical protein
MPYKDPEKERERTRLKSHRDVLTGKSRERKRKWRVGHPAEYKASQAAYRKTESGKESVRRNNRKQTLRRWGWTVEMYDSVFAAQSGLCAICRKPVEGTMQADHEHISPPKPRGLLCNQCNLGLGQFSDDPKTLEEAASYLRRHGKV